MRYLNRISEINLNCVKSIVFNSFSICEGKKKDNFEINNWKKKKTQPKPQLKNDNNTPGTDLTLLTLGNPDQQIYQYSS